MGGSTKSSAVVSSRSGCEDRIAEVTSSESESVIYETDLTQAFLPSSFSPRGIKYMALSRVLASFLRSNDLSAGADPTLARRSAQRFCCCPWYPSIHHLAHSIAIKEENPVSSPQ